METTISDRGRGIKKSSLLFKIRVVLSARIKDIFLIGLVFLDERRIFLSIQAIRKQTRDSAQSTAMEVPWTDTPPTQIREACKLGRILSDRGRHPVSYRYRISNPVKRIRLLSLHVCIFMLLFFCFRRTTKSGSR